MLAPRAMRAIGLGLLGSLLFGCASYQLAPAPTPPIAPLGPNRADVATVCLYRPTSVGAALTIPVRDNGQLVGATHAFTYFCWFAEPGRHRIWVGGGSDADDRSFVLQAGERLQLQHEINFGSDALRVIDANDAETFSRECGYFIVTDGPEDDMPLPSASRVVRAQAQ